MQIINSQNKIKNQHLNFNQMEKLTPEEKKRIIDKLENEFYPHKVEFIGANRFVVREPIYVKADTGEITILHKDKLFNENCEEIPLQNEYNNILIFTVGLAVVCFRNNIQIKDRRSSQNRRDGLIDINGKELLPCIYDSIHVHLDGFIEITKDGVKKATNVNEIINGKFNWDKAMIWEH